MVTKLLNKILGLYVLLRFSHVPRELQYFYRDTYYCQLVQWKYIIKDYIIKKPYKDIHFNGEFAAELMYVLPFAYWHYKNGTLKSTRSSNFTKELYYFSPNHEEKFDIRTTEGNYNFETPRILYSHDYKIQKWEEVPLKETYANSIYIYDKPIVIIANRYNTEWEGPPVSFLSVSMLEFIISRLKHDYTIVYNRPNPKNITMDNSDIYDLNEFEWLKKEHPEVILMEDLYNENKANARNFNHLQLMVYANANHFISTHGGTASLASYFRGINLILSVKGGEHHFGCFHTIFPKLSGAKILHAKNDSEVKEYVEQHFVIH